MSVTEIPFPKFSVYPGLIAKTRQGEYLLVKGGGSKNVKGRKLNPDGTFDTGIWVIPRAALRDTRKPTDAENAAIYAELSTATQFRPGVVVTHNAGIKGFPHDQKWVIIRESDVSVFSLVPLGGDSQGRYLRGVPATSLTVVEL